MITLPKRLKTYLKNKYESRTKKPKFAVKGLLKTSDLNF